MDVDKRYLEAGRINAEALEYGRSLIVVGANTLEVCRAIERRIIELGGQPAFPAQVSMDSTAAHWCPSPEEQRLFQEGELVKLDIGTHVEGCIADMALSIDLSADGRHGALIAAAEKARDAALLLARPGVTLGEIGKTIQDTITGAGFVPVRNLSGHGLAEFTVHTAPSVPNIDTGDETTLQEGMIIAIEPFASTGSGLVHEQEFGEIFSVIGRKPVRNAYARKALKIVARYNGLPFALHHVAGEMGLGPARLAMRELARAGIVEVYPPLVDTKGGIVSQAEHSVIVADEPIVYTRP